MSDFKYRQRVPGGKWRSYDSPDGFLKNAEYYSEIIKNFKEHPAVAVYHIGFCRHSADDRYFNHVTQRYKLVYVLEGSGWFNGLPVRVGQGFLMWQNHVNSMSADIRAPWKFIYVSFSGSLVEEILLRAGFTPEDTIFDVEDIESVKAICEDVVYSTHPERVTEMHLLSVLFDLLSRNKGAVSEKANRPSASDMSEHVYRAVKYMSKHYRSQIGISDVAAAAHISEKYLRELFKKETGKSLQSYLTDLRLAAAKTLLSNSKYNIGEVANLSGFAEYRNFVRIFKERYGITPTEYRTSKLR